MAFNTFGAFQSLFIGKKPPNNPENRLGFPGFNVYGGYLQDKETDARLRGRRKYKTYSEMIANVPIILASVSYFKNILGKSSWKFDPVDDSEEAERYAELVSDIMHDMNRSFEKVVERSAMYYFYGFSIQEWVAKRRDDGVIGFADIAGRPQFTIEQWDVDDHGDIQGVVQRVDHEAQGIYIPRSRLVYLAEDSIDDSPTGLGVLRGVVKAAHRIQVYQHLEGMGFDTDLRGIPIGYGPLSELQDQLRNGRITESEYTTIISPMIDFLTNKSATFDKGLMLDSATYRGFDDAGTPSNVKKWDVKLLESHSQTQTEIDKAIVREIHEIARTLSTEHLVLGDSERGSFQLAKSKIDNFYVIVTTIAHTIKRAYEKDIICKLAELNGWEKKLMPKIQVDLAKQDDPEIISSVLKDLAAAGMVLPPASKAARKVFQLLDLPAPTDDEIEKVREESLVRAGRIQEDLPILDEGVPDGNYNI